jgi:hypothetical protein
MMMAMQEAEDRGKPRIEGATTDAASPLQSRARQEEDETEDRGPTRETEDRGGVLHFATAECCISQQSDIFVRFNFARDRPPA